MTWSDAAFFALLHFTCRNSVALPCFDSGWPSGPLFLLLVLVCKPSTMQRHAFSVVALSIWNSLSLEQWCTTSGPRATSGPRRVLVWPAVSNKKSEYFKSRHLVYNGTV